MKKRLMGIIFLIVAVTLIFGTGLSTTASIEGSQVDKLLNKDSGVPNTHTDLSDDMAELNLSATCEVNFLLDSFGWDEDGINYPSWYGGAYINQNQKAVIQVTYLNDEILSQITSITKNNDMLFRRVSHSYAELEALNNSIAAILDAAAVRSEVAVMSINTYSNDITIGFVLDEKIRAEGETEGITNDDDLKEIITCRFVEDIQSVIQEYTITPFVLNYEFVPARAQAYVDVMPGEGVNISNTTLSLGYRASYQWPATGQTLNGYATTGHATTSTASVTHNGTSLGVLIGDSVFHNGSLDVGFIQVTNSAFTQTNKIRGNTSLTHSTATLIPVVGQLSAFSGRHTYSGSYVVGIGLSAVCGHCGKTLTDLFYVGGTTCVPGDSGGIVITRATGSSQKILGIIHGHATISGTQYSIACKAANITQYTGITPR